MALVEIRNLNVTFKTARGLLHAVENLDLTLEEGELLGIVGESGLGQERHHAGADGAHPLARQGDAPTA